MACSVPLNSAEMTWTAQGQEAREGRGIGDRLGWGPSEFLLSRVLTSQIKRGTAAQAE